MSDAFTVRVAGKEDLPIIHELAETIWPVTYGNILTPDQLRYMLDHIYSLPSLTRQQQEQQHIFLLASLGYEYIGYASWSLVEKPGIYKLHKLYIHPKTQGLGLGKALIHVVIDQVMAENAAALRLNVNRQNKARNFYEKLGFTVIGEEDVDIGNGYFMVDYIMEKSLTRSPSP
jgi:ribosomal protein S18 acetylase RimI-like enzyme